MKRINKSHTFATIGCVALSFAMCLTGCSKGGLSTAGSSISNDVVSISQYKGLKVTDVPVEEISNDVLVSEINTRVEATATNEKVDRASKDGDVLTVDYKGSIDGKEFEGGSAEDVSIEIGSGTYVAANDKYKGFEEQLIGHKAGEDFDITVKFPEDYSDDLANKVAKFSIHIDEVSERHVPELNDAWVVSNSDTSTTVDEYTAEVRATLEKEAADSAQLTLENEVLVELIKNSKFVKEPAEEIDKHYNEAMSTYEEYAKSSNLSLDDFIKQYMGAEDVDEWKNNMKDQAKEDVLREHVFNLIAEKEKLTLSDADYTEQAEALMKDYGYEKLEDFEKDYNKEDIKTYLQQKKVMGFLVDKAEKTDPAKETATTEKAVPTDTDTKESPEATTTAPETTTENSK